MSYFSTDATANIAFKGDASSYDKAAAKVSKQTKELDSDFSKLTAGLKTAAAGYLTLRTAQEALGLARLGEQVNNARTNFNRFFKDIEAGEAGLQRLRNAVGGTMDDLKLLEYANLGFSQGRNVAELEAILEFARHVARTTRREFSEVFDAITDDLTKPTGRVSETIGRFLGEAVHISGREGLIDFVITKNQEFRQTLDESAEAMARFDTNWANVMQSIGQKTKKFLDPAIELINDLLSSADKIANDKNLQKLNEAGTFAQYSPLQDTKSGKAAIQGINSLISNIAKGRVSIEGLEEDLGKFYDLLGSDDLTTKGREALVDFIAELERYKKSAKEIMDGDGGGEGFVADKIAGQLLKAVNEAESPLQRLNAQIELYQHNLETLKAKGHTPESQLYQEENAKLQTAEAQRAALLIQQENREIQFFDRKIARDLAYKDLAISIDKDTVESKKQALAVASDLTEKYYADLIEKAKGNADRVAELEAHLNDLQLAFAQQNLAADQKIKAEREAASAELTNKILDGLKDVERAEYDSELQRAAHAMRYLQQVKNEHKKFNALQQDDKDRLNEALYQSEVHYDAQIKALTMERLAFLEQTFGSVFRDAFNDLLNNSRKEFKDYLSDLAKLMLQFVFSTAVTRFLTAVAGGIPIPGLFGGGSKGAITGGGIFGGGGVLQQSVDPFGLPPVGTDLTSNLTAAIGRIVTSPVFNPSFNPTIQNNIPESKTVVQILVTDDQLAALVRSGETKLRKTDHFRN